MKVYLGSKSPRRKVLLGQMGISFDQIIVDIPEEQQQNESAEAYSRRITTEKLAACWDKILNDNLPLQPLICADTEVVLEGKILGKPLDDTDAYNMLKRYSGQTHEVITSIGLKYDTYEVVELCKTFVTFEELSDQEIYRYLSLGDHIDKAGAYGIQYIGQYVSKTEGCFFSIMGLPMNTLRKMLANLTNYLKRN